MQRHRLLKGVATAVVLIFTFYVGVSLGTAEVGRGRTEECEVILEVTGTWRSARGWPVEVVLSDAIEGECDAWVGGIDVRFQGYEEDTN